MEEHVFDAISFCCPHGQRVYPQNFLGVIAYYHVDDDQSCNFLNMLQTSIQDIAKTVRIEDPVSPKTIAYMTTSSSARNSIYQHLSLACHGKELAQKIVHVLDIYQRSSRKKQLILEYEQTFGKVGKENYILATGNDIFAINSYELSDLHKTIPPQLLMDKLLPEDVCVVPVQKQSQRFDDVVDISLLRQRKRLP